MVYNYRGYRETYDPKIGYYEFIGDDYERSADAHEDDVYELEIAVDREGGGFVIKSIKDIIDGSVQEQYMTTSVELDLPSGLCQPVTFFNPSRHGDSGFTPVHYDLTAIPFELLMALKRLDTSDDWVFNPDSATVASSSASSAAATPSSSSSSSSDLSSADGVTGKRDSSSNPNTGGGALERPKVKRKPNEPIIFTNNRLWLAAKDQTGVLEDGLLINEFQIRANHRAMIPLVQEALSIGADPNYENDLLDVNGNKTYTSILWCAVDRGNVPMAKILLEAGADPNYTSKFVSGATRSTELISSILFRACARYVRSTVQLKHGSLPQYTNRPFAAMVSLLLHYGADPNTGLQTSKKKTSPLTAMVLSNSAQITKLLLEAGANANGTTGEKGPPPLFLAIENGFVDTAKLLIDAGANVVNYPDSIKIVHKLPHPLIHACLRGRIIPDQCKQLIEPLLKAGANPNHTDRFGYSPLLVACGDPNLEFAKYTAAKLIQFGADVNHADEEGNTPLLVACEVCNPNDPTTRDTSLDVVILLKEAGATITDAIKSKYDHILVLALPEDVARERGLKLAVTFGEFHKDEAGKIVPNDDFRCPICQELLKDDVWIVRRCGHALCEDCAAEWGQRSDTCPRCRALGVDFHNDGVYRLQEDMYANLRF